jgi:hypothetical protein
MTDTIDMNDVRLAYHAAVDRFVPDSLHTEHWVRRLRAQLVEQELDVDYGWLHSQKSARPRAD